jgi:hypothetical protein
LLTKGGMERLAPRLFFAFTQTGEAHCRPPDPG